MSNPRVHSPEPGDLDCGGGLAIRVRGLRKRYGDVEAVRGIDLTVWKGEIFAFLGPNGAGKTTTVETLEGYRHRDAGEVEVLGADPARPARVEGLVQCRIGECRLRLHADRAQHPEVLANGGRVTEQRGLADTGLAPKDQDPATSGARVLEQAGDRGLLGFAPMEHAADSTQAISPVPPAAAENWRSSWCDRVQPLPTVAAMKLPAVFRRSARR
jgi:energy-coupling factor transporter ATP-binding protein EcfA2